MLADEGFTLQEIWDVFKTIQVPALSVFNVYVVTIGVFPAVLVEIESISKCEGDEERFFNDLFIPFLFVLFNLGDFTGRTLAGAYEPLFGKNTIWIASLSRWIFVPFFVHCNIVDNKLANIFMSDFWPIFLVSLLGLSNGYVTSLSMMLGPSLVSPSKASVASTIMLYGLTLGLLGGAVTSFVWVAVTAG